jgi:hypothetical protein
LQKAVENYNSVVADKSSSSDDVQKSAENLNLIVDQINKLGMDVDFKQISDTHVNTKSIKLPANISAEIKPYMLSKSYNFYCNDNAVLARVWKTNITVAEFMDKVYPGSLEKLPKETVELYKKTKMTWPTPQKNSSDHQIVSSTNSTHVDNQAITNGVHIATDYNCYYYVYENLQNNGGYKTGSFYAYDQITQPTYTTRVPYLSVSAYMYKDSDSLPFASAQNNAYNAYYVRASGYCTLAAGYHGYYTVGNHYVVWPAGCWPPTSSGTTQTGVVYC